MAEVALLTDKGRMRRAVDEPRPVGAVHAMAHRAPCAPHRVTHVLFDEQGVVGLVAVLAERGHFFDQEGRGLHGGMRVVTVHAPLLHRIMLEPGF